MFLCLTMYFSDLRWSQPPKSSYLKREGNPENMTRLLKKMKKKMTMMRTPMKTTLLKDRPGEEEQQRSKGALLMKACLRGTIIFCFWTPSLMWTLGLQLQRGPTRLWNRLRWPDWNDRRRRRGAAGWRQWDDREGYGDQDWQERRYVHPSGSKQLSQVRGPKVNFPLLCQPLGLRLLCMQWRKTVTQMKALILRMMKGRPSIWSSGKTGPTSTIPGRVWLLWCNRRSRA